jgi:hypothetical protein
MPETEIVPAAAEPPGVPLTAQVTLVFALPEIVALNDCEFGSWTVTAAGATEIVTFGGMGTRVTFACANELGTATEVARMVTVLEAGIMEGAV